MADGATRNSGSVYSSGFSYIRCFAVCTELVVVFAILCAFFPR